MTPDPALPRCTSATGRVEAKEMRSWNDLWRKWGEKRVAYTEITLQEWAIRKVKLEK